MILTLRLGSHLTAKHLWLLEGTEQCCEDYEDVLTIMVFE